MADDVTFCGVFDGHGPHGHLVSRRVRDTLPLKILSSLNSSKIKEVLLSDTCCNGDLQSDAAKAEKSDSGEDNISSLWRDIFLKSYKATDKELRSHPDLDCFCSGSTAVSIVKQVRYVHNLYVIHTLDFSPLSFYSAVAGFKSFHGKHWGFSGNHGVYG